MKEHQFLIKSATTNVGAFSDRERKRLRILSVQEKLKRIQEEARKALPKDDKPHKLKNFSKPQRQIIYLNKKAMFTKLKHFSTRIDVGKYRMLIEVSRDKWKPKEVSEKNPDDIREKEYHHIYKEYIQGKASAACLNVSNQVLSIYQIYDQNDDELRKTNIKLEEWRKKNCFTPEIELKTRKMSQDLSHSQFQMRAPQLKEELTNEYELLAAKSKLFDNPSRVSPQFIIKDRFHRKFFCDRKKKLQTRRLSQTIQNIEEDKLPIQINASALSENRFANFQSEQKKIMNHYSRAGICQENKKKLQGKLQEIFFQIRKPELLKRVSRTQTIQPTI